jgi:hypothetical protein
MIISAAIWNGKKTKVLAVEDFSSTKELLDFVKELQVLDKDITYNLTSVRKGK